MDGDVETLQAHLEALKRRGANVLLLDGPASGDVCDRLLGADDQLRRRLFVAVGRSAPEPGIDDPDSTRFGVIERAGEETRGVAASGSGSGGQSALSEYSGSIDPVGPANGRDDYRTADRGRVAWYSRLDADDSLPTLAWHVNVHLSRFESADPVPGEIRVCFDSLDALDGTASTEDLFRSLHLVTHRIRAAGGIGHFHVSPGEGFRRARFIPLFDAVIETRPGEDGPLQRWTFPEEEVRTDWLPID